PAVERLRYTECLRAQVRVETLARARHARQSHQLARTAAVALLVEFYKLAADVLARSDAEARRVEGRREARGREVFRDDADGVEGARGLSGREQVCRVRREDEHVAARFEHARTLLKGHFEGGDVHEHVAAPDEVETLF